MIDTGKARPLGCRDKSKSKSKSHVGRRWFVTLVASLPAFTLATAAFAQGAANAEAAQSGDEAGSLWWTELHTGDQERSRSFYSRVVGWTAKAVALEDPSRPPQKDEKEYTVFTVNGREAAGAMRIESAAPEPQAARWVPYFQVANVDAAVVGAVELGGKVVEAPFDMPNVGKMAILQDPEGASFGLVSPYAASAR